MTSTDEPDEPDEPDLIYSGECITIRSISSRRGDFPLKRELDGLKGKLAARKQAAFRVVDTSIATGRSGGRLDKLRSSRLGLLELKLTRPGGSPPHLRLFVLRSGNTLWVVHMIHKTTPRIAQSDTDAADSFAQRWLNDEGAEKLSSA